MSKARLVITAVLVEGRRVGELSAAYGVARSWIYELLARYGPAEGDGAFEPRSRRPLASPSALPQASVELIIGLRRQLAGQGWMPAHTPLPGIWPSSISEVVANAMKVLADLFVALSRIRASKRL